MTYFADLTPYSYGSDLADGAVNIGWLSPPHEFPIGVVPDSTVAEILRAVRRQPVNRMRGWHRCQLCENPPYPARMEVDGEIVTLGDAEIRVHDTEGMVYAAPSLVAHYIAEHRYLPPLGFIEAVCRPTAAAG
ncbi:MAG: DUF7919 family protein [Acidimicrobiales bacterium]